MEIKDRSFGMFSLLPPEIRTIIWQHLIPHLHVRRSLPRKPDCLSPEQGILLSSRRIYAEVAAQVPYGYNDNTMELDVRAEYRCKSWIRAKNSKEVYWDFEDTQDAISRGFCDLPWHEMNVQICIRPPGKDDSAQLICLYKKVRALVEILKKAKGFKSLWVDFRHTESSSWFDNARPQCSYEKMAHLLPVEGELRGLKWDYEFIFPMFLQIQNVKVAKISSSEILEGKQENAAMSHNFAKGEEFMKASTLCEVENKPVQYYGIPIRIHLKLVFLKVERMLDNLPTHTANMLRLERFSSWYTDKLHGNSPYEDELWRIVGDGLDGIDSMDDRYRYMRAHNPLSLANRSAFPENFDSIKHLDITDARGWNREAWHCVYENGIPPLNSKEIVQCFRKWSAEYDAPDKGGEFLKLYLYFTLLIVRKPRDVEMYF